MLDIKNIFDFIITDFRKLKEHEIIYKTLIAYHSLESNNKLRNKLLRKLIFDYSQAEIRLNELNQLKNKFLGIAAHDLRNPLASIKGFTEILLEDKDKLSDDQKEMLNIIYDSSENMLALINDLLDVSIIESGKLTIDKKIGSITEIVEKKIRYNSMIAGKKNISIEYHSDKNIPEFKFDPDRIGQVIDNLISNAIKFSLLDTIVFVDVKREKEFVILSVRDQGPGLSQEDREKLFGEFQKLSARPTGGERSTGLVLAIVKKIIDAHDGSITVESEPGKGAKFIFTLPMEK